MGFEEAKLHAFMGKVLGDFGSTLSSALVSIGDRLGLYKAMGDGQPVSSEQLAQKTGTHERYVREWLVNQAASGYITYDPASQKYSLPAEHAAVLIDEGSPAGIVGGFQVILGMVRAQDRICEAFKTGKGMTWSEHHEDLFVGTERFFRPGYAMNLVATWIPAMPTVKEKLESGITVADVGCGHGASTIVMAKAFPKSKFYGFDNHPPSIEAAKKAAAAAGVGDRIVFEVAGATTFPNHSYGLIAYFDCLHDMGQPVEAIQHAAKSLTPDGAVLLVEPMCGEKVEDNLNPVGRVFSGASVLCCTPNAIATGPIALGTMASEAKLKEILAAGGFTKVRRASETPFNRIFEVRR